MFRSRDNKKIGGVCGGLSEMMDIDVSIVRLIFAFCLFTPFPIITIYLLMWIIVPSH